MIQKQVQLEIFDLGRRIKKDSAVDKANMDNTPEPKFPTQFCVKIASLLVISIISFTLGVEHGKTIIKNNSVRSLAEKRVAQVIKEAPVEKDKPQKSVVGREDIKKAKINQNLISADEYIIQVATYKKDSSYVDKEASKLKQKGYVAFLIPSDSYMQLCAGKFSSRKIATEHLKKLEQTYKGCFIRKI